MEGDRPTGTVSFLFTDVEGSTRLWEEEPAAAADAIALHDRLVRAAIEQHRGFVFSAAGDGFAAAFWTPMEAIEAAAAAQRSLYAVTWPTRAPVAVRMGVHSGTADERDGDYFGPTLNRAARLMSAAHGGQIVVSAAAQRLVASGAPRSWDLVELGTFRLKDLSAPEVVFQVAGAGLAPSFPPLRSLGVRSHNLPAQTTAFFGRKNVVAALGELLDSERLVTLVAGGGAGKTRTALQAAAEVVDRFEGVYFVELTPLRDPAHVVARLIESMGHVPIGLSADAVDRSLVDRIGDRSLLLVLDNCEHLLEECARVVQLLLVRCPNLRVLATSRQPLGVPGERLQPLAGLSTPTPAATPSEIALSDAGALFLDRARAVRPDFDVNASNAAAVGEICRVVGGLPLALELAAARMRAMSPADVAQRISRSLRVLSSSSRVVDERHRTLDACLAWSFDALPGDAATVLRRLSVFAGGATLEACGVVCAGDDLDALEVEDHLVTLVDRSLVTLEDTARGARYRLHELVRQFSRGRLTEAGEADAIRTRHLDWCVDLVRRCSPALAGLTTLDSVEPLLAEADNLAVAVRWAIDHKDAVALVRILGGGGMMWAHVNKMRQLGDWWDAALPLLPAAPDADFPPNRLALALASAAAAIGNNGRYRDAAAILDRLALIPGVSEETESFARWLDLSYQMAAGREVHSLHAPFAALVEHTTERNLGIEFAARHQLGLIDCMIGAPERARAVLEAVFDRGTPAAIAMLGPVTDALIGLSDVIAAHLREGLERLEEVSGRAEVETTHWRYFVLTVDTVGRVIAGQRLDAVPSALRSLTCTTESSMFWCIVYAVEAAALLAARLGAREVALDALGAIDHELAAYGGRPFSATPGTVLHDIRGELGLIGDADAGAGHAPGRTTVLDMAGRLRTDLAARLP